MTIPRRNSVGRTLPILALAALAFVGIACSESTVPAGPARHLTLMTGAGQSGLPADTLAQLLTVRVTDDAGQPVAGAAVTWSSTSSGTFVPATITSDGEGLARATWVLGVGSGIQTAEARAAGWDDRLTVTAEAVAGLKAVSLMQGNSNLHMCALDAEGAAWCWGSNGHGELGDGSAPVHEYRETPVRVAGGHRFRALAGMSEVAGTTCGITDGDELWCWGGSNDVFEGPATVNAPIRVAGDMHFRTFDMRRRRICAVTPEHEGYCWGRGEFGDGLAGSVSHVPIPVAEGHAWRQIVPGEDGTCGIALDGEVFCWSASSDAGARFGLPGPGPFLVPTAIPIVPKLRTLTSNWNLQCGLLYAGPSALCWGYGYAGPPPSPHLPLPRLTFHKLSSGIRASGGIDASGSIWLWGGTAVCCGRPLPGQPLKLRPDGPWMDLTVIDSEVWAILASDSTVYAWSGSLGESPQPSAIPAPAP